MSQTYAKVIADSVSPQGHRVTTMEVCFHRFVLAEFNTHRVFSRNSASSRAIPFRKQQQKVLSQPAIPVSWPAEQKGMQGGEELHEVIQRGARQAWTDAALHAAHYAGALAGLGVHKSVANRLLEPFQMHTAVITATDWDGFWEQRCSPLAQPEIRVAAEAMKAAYDANAPTLIPEDDWHLPYVSGEERANESHWSLVQVSAARCARVSYLTQDGKRDIQADLDLYDRLVSARPAHWSPLEHVATPDSDNVLQEWVVFANLNGFKTERLIHRPRYGNLLGWRQHRFEMES